MQLARDARRACKRSRHRRPAGWCRRVPAGSRLTRHRLVQRRPSGPCKRMEDDLAPAKRFVIAVLPREEVAPVGPDDLQRAQVRRRAVAGGNKIVRGLDLGNFQQYHGHAGQHVLEAHIRRKAFPVAQALRQVAQHGSREFRRKAEDDELVQAAQCEPGGIAVRRNPGLRGHRHHVPTLRAHTLSDLLRCCVRYRSFEALGPCVRHRSGDGHQSVVLVDE